MGKAKSFFWLGTVLLLAGFFLLSRPHNDTPPRQPEKLTMATEGGYPPFNYVDEQGQLKGFDVDIARALCRDMNVECDVVARDWDQLLPGLARGEYDFIVASMANTPERREYADFTGCYYRSRSAFAGRTDLQGPVTAETVTGLTLATQQGTVQAEFLRENYGAVAQLRYTQNVEELYDLLVQGEADLILVDSLNILEFLTSEEGLGFDFIGAPLPPEDISSCASIAVRKDTGLRKSLNTALKNIRLSGDYDDINRAYFPFSVY